jgi:hypothetical protein
LGKAVGLKTLGLANNNFGGNIPSDLGLLISLGMYKYFGGLCLYIMFVCTM